MYEIVQITYVSCVHTAHSSEPEPTPRGRRRNRTLDGSVTPRTRSSRSDVDPVGLGGVFLYELLAWLDGVAHQHGEHTVGSGSVLDGYLLEHAVLGVHRRVPQLLGVHFPETLEPLDPTGVAAALLGNDLVALLFGHHVVRLSAVAHAVQRGLRGVHVPRLEQRAHVPVEERQQERADVGAVDIGVGRHDDPLVAGLVDIELLADARASRRDHVADLVVLQHAVQTVFLDVEHLAADREHGLELGVAGLLRAAASAVALDDEQFGVLRVTTLTVRELARQRGGV